MAQSRRIDRRSAEQAGRRAERVAALWLQAKLYRIIGRRFRCSEGEVDLIARRGRMVCFIEVKARPRTGDAATAVTPMAEQRIAAAGAIWLARHAPHFSGDVRYDVIAVGSKGIRHIRDAWRPDDHGSRSRPESLF